MRNLKRALSLALATVMTMGLMMVGTGASYQDVKATDNVEAIEVLQTVGIMTGDENGDFNPDANVTRNEMAVIMANLLNLDYDYYRGTNPFTDVPSWAAPYVAACAAEGVTAGAGGNFYNGAGNVTASEAALMIMKALGYFQYQADFGDDWKVATVRQASYIDLFANINATAETALTRNQIAQLVLNGLKANMVEFTGDVGTEATIGDTTINIGYRAEYTAKTNANSKYNSIDTGTTTILVDNGQYFVQLGEELYNGDLKLKPGVDVFSRPAHVWSFDGEEIGTYVNYDLMVQEYTTSVTGKELYDVIGKTAFDKYGFESYVDGAENDLYKEISKNNKDNVSETGNGALTQVFVDSKEESVVVTVVNTYLAEATTDYNEKKEEASFEIYGLNKIRDVSSEDFAIEDIAEGDFVLVTYSFESEEIETISDVEILSDVTVEKFTSNDQGNNSGNDVSSVTVDGTKYNSSNTLTYDVAVLENYTNSNLKDKTYNVYLDKYGYAIGVEEVEGVDNYLFLTGINGGTDYLATANYEANVIFMDGTSEVVKVKNNADIRAAIGNADGQALVNQWFKFTKNSSDVYTLTAITDNMKVGTNSVGQYQTKETTPGMVIDDRNISLKAQINNIVSNVYGNEDSVYLIAELDTVTVNGDTFGVITKADEVITGVDNVDAEVWNDTEVQAELKLSATDKVAEGVYALYDDDGVVIAAVVVGESEGISSNVVYVNSNKASEESYADGTWTWTREVVINGELVTLTETSDEDESVLADEMKQYNWYTVKYDAEGNVKKATIYDASTESGKYAKSLTDAVPMLRNEDLVILDIDGVGVNYNKNGRTVYDWTEKTDDNGIVVNSDVKFVIRQINKNKTTTEEYTGWNQLVSALETLNVTRDYDFNAVIENGRITSVVIIDYTGDEYVGPDGTIKGNVATNATGSSANVSSMSIAANGRLRATFTYNVPAQIADGAMTDYDLIVYVDGAYYDTIPYGDPTLTTTNTIDNGKVTITYVSGVMDFYGINASSVTFEFENEEFQNVKVRYYDVDNKVYLDSSDFVTGKMTESVVIGGTAKIPFQLKTNATDTITYAVKQGNKLLSGATEGNNAANHAYNGVTPSSAYTANDYVVVEITGLGDLTARYSVTGLNDTLGDLYAATPAAAKNLNIQVSADRSNVVAGSAVTVTFQSASTIPTTSEVGYAVTFSTGDVLVFANNNTAPSNVTRKLVLNDNVAITVEKVETISAPTITKVEFKDNNTDGKYSVNDEIIVYFSEAVKQNPTCVDNGTIKRSGTLSDDKTSISYKITTAPGAATDYITISAITSGATGVINTGSYKVVVDGTETSATVNSLSAVYTPAP